jgi:ATP-dependent DNA ligase
MTAFRRTENKKNNEKTGGSTSLVFSFFESLVTRCGETLLAQSFGIRRALLTRRVKRSATIFAALADASGCYSGSVSCVWISVCSSETGALRRMNFA